MKILLHSLLSLFVLSVGVLRAEESVPEIVLVEEGSFWTYRNDDITQNHLDSWRRHARARFNGSMSGRAPLGYGAENEATVISFGDDPANKPITTYFRREFNAGAPASATLILRFLADDGIIVHINGVELYRNNLPEGEIGYEITALTATEGEVEGEWVEVELPANGLRALVNVIAVEVHQHSAADPNLRFDLSLIGRGVGNLDTDGNGIDDAWEVEHFGNFVNIPWSDGDNDGLSVRQEYHAGTDPTTSDTDGDYAKDGTELDWGTDPLVTESAPRTREQLLGSEYLGSGYNGIGEELALSGSTLVAGSPSDGEFGTGAGAVFVFERVVTEEGLRWGGAVKLTASDPAEGNNFGQSAAIHRDTIVVGEENRVFVFERSADGWVESAILTPNIDGHAGLGRSVAIYGNTIVASTSRGGVVYVFHRTNAGWEIGQRLAPAEGDGDFGDSIAMHKRSLIVGSPGQNSGAVIFQRGFFSNEWRETATLSMPRYEEFYDSTSGFGYNVAIHDGVAVVSGVPEDPNGTVAAVPAHVFERHAGGYNNWGPVAALHDNEETLFYAWAIAASRNVIAVRSERAVHTYKRRWFGAERWVAHRKIVPQQAFATGAIVLGGNTIATGAGENFWETETVMSMPLHRYSRLRNWLARFIAQWRSSDPDPDAAALMADPDEDGLSNLFEFAVGTDPLRASALPGAAFGSDYVEGEAYFTFSFSLLDPVPAGVTYAVQSSDNLQDWKTIATRDPNEIWSGDATVWEEAAVEGRVEVTVRDVTPMSLRARGYLRLVVTVDE